MPPKKKAQPKAQPKTNAGAALISPEDMTLEEIEYLEGEGGYTLEEIAKMEERGGVPKVVLRAAALIAWKRQHPNDTKTTGETLKKLTMVEFGEFLENLAVGNPTKGPDSPAPDADAS